LLKRTIVANFVGQGWSGLLNLALGPVYLAYLGAEAYGLIGFFLSLQALLSVLDLGLTATATREVARLTSRDAQASTLRPLVRGFALLYVATGSAIALLFLFASGPLATEWLNASNVEPSILRISLVAFGSIIGLRWTVTLCIGVLRGLRRDVLLNGALMFTAGLRHIGSGLVLVFVSPTLVAFLVWQLVAAAIEGLLLARIAWRELPAELPDGPVLLYRRDLAAFSAVVAWTSICAAVLKQLDRIVISGLLPLVQMGYYTAAGTLGSGISLLAAPVALAAFPRLTALVQSRETAVLAKTYHRISQLVAFIVSPVAAGLIFFAGDVLVVWSGSAEVAAGAQRALMLLSIGGLLNAMMQVPYALQLAARINWIAAWTNSLAVILLTPLLFWLVPSLGITGGAAVWAGFNVCYYFTTPLILHRHVLQGHAARWFLEDTLPFMTASVGMGVVLFQVRQSLGIGVAFMGSVAVMAIIYVGVSVWRCRALRDAVADLSRTQSATAAPA
jgi:O-antigen/teichoic acid export membrane protein